MTMSTTTREPRQWQRIFCPHCGEKVSKSTYYRHREEFYDVRSGGWKGSDDPISGSQIEADSGIREPSSGDNGNDECTGGDEISVQIGNTKLSFYLIRRHAQSGTDYFVEEDSCSDSDSGSKVSENEELSSDEAGYGEVYK